MKLYIHKGQPLVKQAVNDKVTGYFPVEYTELKEEPKISVNIGKIPLHLWRTINCFFKKVAMEEKSEAQVRLFYSDVDKTWKAHAFPQKAKTSMTTQELCDHPDFQPQMNAITDNDKYYQFGTIHSHVFASAFQSGTDKNDELSCPGIHITIGKLDQKQVDLHERFTLIIPGSSYIDENQKQVIKKAKKYMLSPNLMDFIQIPEKYIGEECDDELKKIVFNYLIRDNSDNLVDNDLIDQWMKNRIEEKIEIKKPEQLIFSNDKSLFGAFGSGPRGDFDWGQNYKNKNDWIPSVGDSSKKNNKSKERENTQNYSIYLDGIRRYIEPIVDKICAEHKITHLELANILSKDSDNGRDFSNVNILLDVDSKILSVFGISRTRLIIEIENWVQEYIDIQDSKLLNYGVIQ